MRPVRVILDEYIASLRAFGVEPLSGAHFRKGPQHGFRLPSGVTVAVLVGLRGTSGSETGGIGRRSMVTWNIDGAGLVPISASGASETHLDLAQCLWDWHQADRSVGGTVLRAQLTSLQCLTDSYLSDTDQEFHVVEWTSAVQVLRTDVP